MVSRARPRKPSRGLALVALALLAGCRSEMYDQPRYEPQEASAFFADGKADRPPVPGTIARGHLRADELLYTGKVGGKDADEFPFEITRADILRGKERFMIYCAPCHSPRGDGRGIIVRRGFTPPPPFYGKRPRDLKSPVPTYEDLRQAPVGHFFGVITNGHGAMYSYASRVSVEDRWRIAAFIRALQLSQHATTGDLRAIPDPTPEERNLLQGVGR